MNTYELGVNVVDNEWTYHQFLAADDNEARENARLFVFELQKALGLDLDQGFHYQLTTLDLGPFDPAMGIFTTSRDRILATTV